MIANHQPATLNSKKSTYLTEAVEYLVSVGLSTTDIPIAPYISINNGLKNKKDEMYILDGWAYQVMGDDLKPRHNQYLMKVCNYPKEALYLDDHEYNYPTFVQSFKGNLIHYCSKFEDIAQSKIIQVHENISSAHLSQQITGIPALAVNGVRGWETTTSDLSQELARLIKALSKDCKIIVCFDGYVTHNQTAMVACGQFKSCVNGIRNDIEIVLLETPNGSRWDEYIVSTGDDNVLINTLRDTGIEIQESFPLGYLIREYGVSVTDAKVPEIEQTLDNYIRLLNHPKWADYSIDIGGDLYKNDTCIPFKDATFAFLRWMERDVCRGYSGKIKLPYIKSAFQIHTQNNHISRPIQILKDMPPTTLAEATQAARRLFTEGFKYIGDLTPEQLDFTVLCMCRDMIMLWGNDPNINPQWVLCLIGRTGVGKSNFMHSFLEVLWEAKYPKKIGVLMKEGSRAKLDEFNRVVRDTLVATFDEYNPNDKYAKFLEQDIFTLSSTRTVSQRRLYDESTDTYLRHAALTLTTVNTPTNKQFIRSNTNSGERRFIPLEIDGVMIYEGFLVGNREVIKDCGRTLMRWAAHHGEQFVGDATRYSKDITYKFIRKTNTVGFITKAGVVEVMRMKDAVKIEIKNPDRVVYRFTFFQLLNCITSTSRVTSETKEDLKVLIAQAGAVYLGSARISGNNKTEKKENVYEVHDWEAFCTALEDNIP